MGILQAPGPTLERDRSLATAPLVVLFERDDAIAVPLLSQLRIAGYDVRAARTPVDLFSVLSKQLVALVLVDLGNATAGRREFWVALDAQRRGRALQVMTFRYLAPISALDLEMDPAARALADMEVHGAHEFQKIVDGVRQRIPLHGTADNGLGRSPMSGAIAPIGAALGMRSPLRSPFAVPASANPFSADLVAPAAPSAAPLADRTAADASRQHAQHAAPASSFTPTLPALPPDMPPSAAQSWATSSGDAAASPSPFAQPYRENPFAPESATSGPLLAASAIQHLPVSGPPDSGAASYGMGGYDPFGASGQRAAYDAFGRSGADAFASGAPAWAQPMTPSAPQAPQTPQAPHYSGPVFDGGTPIADTWTPPDAGSDAGRASARQASGPGPSSNASRADAWPEFSYPRGGEPRLDATPQQQPPQLAYQPAPPMREPPEAALSPRRAVDSQALQGPTMPIPAPPRVPALRRDEQSLGAVLVEGALLSPQRLEALTGIQQMLANVHMELKLGELALLFKFLSPDQLLAALLVSRRLVSPQQIAALGRVKQELGVSGMDHDLESLLIMFRILPPEQLQALRAELA